jgi:acyl-CoA thioester hydrolase
MLTSENRVPKDTQNSLFALGVGGRVLASQGGATCARPIGLLSLGSQPHLARQKQTTTYKHFPTMKIQYDESLFRLETPIALRYSDIDMLQHVNNASYLSFMEEARIHYFLEVAGWTGEANSLNIVLARSEMDFVRPLFLLEKCVVKSRVFRLGTKSFEMEYLIGVPKPTGFELACYAKAVLVGFSMETQAAMVLPEEFKARVQAYEPGFVTA